jgi:amidophosphoribosyltransferase
MTDESIPDKMEEACGVFGVYSPTTRNAAELTYLGLLALQHRGQESAGITAMNDGSMNTIKGMGLLPWVFRKESVEKLPGNIAIGHVRYSTAGGSTPENAQPLEGHCKLGHIALAHNGNLVNSEVIRSLMEDAGVIFHTTSDTEVVLNLIAQRTGKGMEEAIRDTSKMIKGSYALVILVNGKLIGVRDPYGIRPLCIGKMEGTFFLTSESCALDAVGGQFVRDVRPGEIVIIDENGITSIEAGSKNNLSTCLFEYIYFARPDSLIDGIYVNEVRERCGMELFKEKNVEADIVIGVPDSGIPAALGYSMASGIPFRLGFIKNRYVGRTFITPTQEMRERAVQLKLSPLRNDVAGKRIMLIDDSIVRGTTSRRLITKLREAGASEVHFGVVSPPVAHPCYFGIDTPYSEELVASKMDVESIRKLIGADSLVYLSMDGIKRALGRTSGFCEGCFSGVYPISPHN